MDPKYPLSEETKDGLLTRLAEEASEVIKVVMKIQRFGLDNYHPKEPHISNRERLHKEVEDFRHVWEEILRRRI